VSEADGIPYGEIEFVGGQGDHLGEGDERDDRLVAQDRAERQRGRERGREQQTEEPDQCERHEEETVARQQIAAERHATGHGRPGLRQAGHRLLRHRRTSALASSISRGSEISSRASSATISPRLKTRARLQRYVISSKSLERIKMQHPDESASFMRA